LEEVNGMSVGLLILRVVLGAVFIGHGTQKLFGWLGGGGPDGTGSFLHGLGYRPGKPSAVVAGSAEALGGLSLLLGLLTFLGAAAVIGVMVNAMVAVHVRNGFWNSNGGIEFPLINIAAATCLAFVGPGRISFDWLIGWHLWGIFWGVLALVIGFAAAIAMLAVRGSNLRSPSRSVTQGRHAA
jgi:putative oxidoreductase